MMGYNNYGMGGGGYGRGASGGGTEMMMMVMCCICCVCLVSCLGGYFSNMMCSISPTLGRSCNLETPTPTMDPYEMGMMDTSTPAPAGGGFCNSTYAGQSRVANDPRPALRAEACIGQTRTGRDCFYWRVETDVTTGLAKWVRVVDGNNEQLDSRDASCANPPVTGPSRVDFAKLGTSYTGDASVANLINLGFKARTLTASNSASISNLITQAAKKVGVRQTTLVWNKTHSDAWVRVMGPAFQGRDLRVQISNCQLAAVAVKRRLNKASIDLATWASMLESSLYSNQSDWINSVATNTWSQNPNRYGGPTEAAYVQYLNRTVGGKLQNWYKIIRSPSIIRRL